MSIEKFEPLKFSDLHLKWYSDMDSHLEDFRKEHAMFGLL